MKASMMKLGVFVMMAAIAMFTLVAMASAGGQTIHGTYAVVGSAQCAMSFMGVDPNSLLPNGGGSFSPGPVTYYDGVYTFSPNGRGSASLTGKGFNSAGGPTDPVGGWVQQWEYDFTYKVNDRGEITFSTIAGSDTSTTIQGPGTGAPAFELSTGPQQGNISPDGNLLLIHCGAPVTISIVNATDFGLPPDAELLCNITLNGFKQWPR